MALPEEAALEAWLRDWLNHEHAECESGIDLCVAFICEFAEHLDVHGANDPEYERVIAVCLHLLVKKLPSEWEHAIVDACEARLGVTITRVN